MSDFHDPIACSDQAPLSTGCPRQEYWSRLPFSSPGGLSDPGIEPASPVLSGRFFTAEPSGKPLTMWLFRTILKLKIQFPQSTSHMLSATTLHNTDTMFGSLQPRHNSIQYSDYNPSNFLAPRKISFPIKFFCPLFPTFSCPLWISYLLFKPLSIIFQAFLTSFS